MGEEHATTVAGEGKNPTERHIMQVAGESGLNASKAEKIMEQLRSATSALL
jgi:hypothetical protein